MMAIMTNAQRIKRLHTRIEALSAKRKAVEADVEQLRRAPAGSVVTKDQLKKEWWAAQAKAAKK